MSLPLTIIGLVFIALGLAGLRRFFMTKDSGADPALAVPAKPASGLDASRCDPGELLALAERCEQATADQQRELLLEAFEALTAEFVATPSAIRFVQMLDAEAYESAAMTLVPKGWVFGRLAQNPISLRWYCDLDWHPLSDDRDNASGSNAAPALALCAAALRAGAAQ